jgi:hypothetical protein
MRDFSPRVVALFALGFAILLGGTLALMIWIVDLFHVTPEGHGLQTAPVVATPPHPPEPRLQASPTGDLLEMRHANQARLQSYGWVDRSINMVRMPIERAMQLVVEQGLPSWHEIPTPPTGEHNSRAAEEGR